MIKKTIQKRTTSALLWHLGYENDPPIMHNVIATALDMLDDKARADVIQYLSADQSAATETQAGVCPNCGYGPVIALPAPAATENKCPYCPHPNTEHRDGFCSKCECGGYLVIAEPAARGTPVGEPFDACQFCGHYPCIPQYHRFKR